MAPTTKKTAASPSLVLSLFPGIDLLGRGFEEQGYCIVRGPDLIFGGDVRRFSVPPGRFDGVIGGSPCQDFSNSRHRYAVPPTGEGLELLAEFARIVAESDAAWWLLENVPAVPDVKIPGYSWLRIPLDARDFGARQRRLRHFQYGHREHLVPIVTRRPRAALKPSPTCMASEASRPNRRTFADFCRDQGLPGELALPFTVSARYAAVGNGVHLDVARALAAAIAAAVPAWSVRLCACGCARQVEGRRELASAACRKRAQRRRDSARAGSPGAVTGSDPAGNGEAWSVTKQTRGDAAAPLDRRRVTERTGDLLEIADRRAEVDEGSPTTTAEPTAAAAESPGTRSAAP
jgi:DNA (cytosine-5)-methyltransferase 1